MGYGPGLDIDPTLGWVLGSFLLLFAVWLWQRRVLARRVPPRRAALLALLRTASVAVVILLAAGPRIVRRTFRAEQQPLHVAIDTSRSMGLPDVGGKTRIESVKEFLASSQFRKLAEHYLISYTAFSDTVVSVPPEDIAGLVAAGSKTDVSAATRRTVDDGSGAAALLLFTDGGHSAPGESNPEGDGAPVIVVGVGSGERLADVEVADVDRPAIAFAGQPAILRVRVRADGYAGREVPLVLRSGDQVFLSRTVKLPETGDGLEVPLTWTPPTVGRHLLTVEIPPLEDEQLGENNRAEFVLDAARDRIRVLLLSGTPSWSYRFLREALKGDPSVDLVSFIILRSASDSVNVRQEDLSLIPFPTQKIFMEELPNFDLLIFDNFSHQPYLPAGYLDRVEQFVRAGGGFWMLGGPLSFYGGRYESTPLADLLPVRLPEERPSDGGYRDGAVPWALTPAGRTHPFFDSPGSAVQRLADLEGYNVAGPPREGSTVLAEVTAPGLAPQPLVILGRHGRGRVLAVLTDSLWRVGFEPAVRGAGNLAYLAFVRQGVRWSIGDPDLQQVRVEFERATLAPGERLRARAHVLGEDFLPADAAEISVLVRTPSGRQLALAPVRESPGVFLVEADAPEEGGYELTVEASSGGRKYARAAAPAVAAWPAEEFRAPGLNREALSALIASRGGAVLELGDSAATARAVRSAIDEVVARHAGQREESISLAEQFPAFLLLLALLGAEWILRRRWGLD